LLLLFFAPVANQLQSLCFIISYDFDAPCPAPPAGYYLATLEAATQHIFDLADQYEAQQDSASSRNSGGVGGGGGGGGGNEGPIVDAFEDFES
jgi:hypothetical protein